MKKILVLTVAVLLSALFTSLLYVDNPTGQVTLSEVKSEQGDPSFTNMEATVYHSVEEEDYEEWSTGAAAEYDVDTDLGYCVIPEDERGFYEDVKCQGSGVGEDGGVYHTSTIEPSEADSTTLNGFENGRTSTGTDPEPQRTVAINPAENTPCCIEYGTEMYISWGENNPWNGVYKAEDTGSAFRGECKIDVFAGTGLDSVDQALEHVHDSPKIWLLDEGGYCGPGSAGQGVGESQPTVRGEQTSRYSNQQELPAAKTFYENARRFGEEIKNLCTLLPYEEKESCIEDNALVSAVSNGVFYNSRCISEGIITNNFSSDEGSSGGIVRLANYDEDEQTVSVTFSDIITSQPHTVEFDLDRIENHENLDLREEGEGGFNITEDIQKGTIIEFLTNVEDTVTDRSSVVFNPEEPATYLVRNVANRASDCFSSSNSSCHCTFDLDERVKALTFVENKVRMRGQPSTNSVRTVPGIDRGVTNLSDSDNVSVSEDEQFTIEVDESIYFHKENDSLLVMNEKPQNKQCDLQYRHENICLTPHPDESRAGQHPLMKDLDIRYTIKI